MRVTVDIPDELWAQAMAASGCRTKRETAIEGLNHLISRRPRAGLDPRLANCGDGEENEDPVTGLAEG